MQDGRNDEVTMDEWLQDALNLARAAMRSGDRLDDCEHPPELATLAETIAAHNELMKTLAPLLARGRPLLHENV